MSFALSACYVNGGDGSTTGYWAVTPWSTGATIAAGALRRQTAPALGSERVFVCIVAGTTDATTEPTWVTTVGAKTTDNTVTWMECTGQPAVNGDAANARAWSASRAFALGETIVDSNSKVQICTTAGTSKSGSAPTWSTTTGGTTTDNTVTWTCLGSVSSFAVTGFAAPHSRLANAQVASWYPSVSPNLVFVSQHHVETQASALTITFGGTGALPTHAICVDDSVIPPTAASVTTGASVSTTGSSALALAGAAGHIIGISFFAGSGAVNSLLNLYFDNWLRFDNCALGVLGTTGGIITQNAGSHSSLELNNVTMQFGSTGSLFLADGRVRWNGGSVSTAITNFISGAASQPVDIKISGVDLSNVSGALMQLTSSAAGIGVAIFESCLLASGVALTTGTPTIPSKVDIRMVNCDVASGVTGNYVKSNYATGSGNGNQTETTVVKTDGSSDGTTPFSRKIVTSANTSLSVPFALDPIYVWINSTGSAITPIIAIVNDGLTLTNAEIWCEVEYFGSSSDTRSSIATDGAANVLATPANQPADATSTWTTTGLSSPVKQTVGPAFTPQKKGLAKITVKVARPSLTVYIDQKPTGLGFTSARQYQASEVMMNEGAGGGNIPIGGGNLSGGFL